MSCGDNVFFHEQKTAYELRISDWGSDVCSSDLLAASATSLARCSWISVLPCASISSISMIVWRSLSSSAARWFSPASTKYTAMNAVSTSRQAYTTCSTERTVAGSIRLRACYDGTDVG